jgi:sec-independent protein translocase protein TatA
MPDLGAPELLIILVIALLVFGSSRLPKLARSLGQASREFKAATSGEWLDDQVRTAGTTPAPAAPPPATPPAAAPPPPPAPPPPAPPAPAAPPPAAAPAPVTSPPAAEAPKDGASPAGEPAGQ